ncbi:AgmX/PglI C-terminal domain-containing protein, partial [bacterium]|nr:AgmX/PglI C-terminal domain-containing protein [bacterium]
SDLSSTDINAVINAAVGRITYCFSRGIEENPEMSGVATIQFTIEPTGRVSNAVVSASTLGSPVAEECLRRRVMRLHFPAYAGAPKTVRFPFKYSR